MTKKIGIIVPTLGVRFKYLQQSLMSIRSAGRCHIAVVSPDKSALLSQINLALFDQWIQDPMQGLATAINLGVESLPESIEYFNWLGDDDTLTPKSLTYSSLVMMRNPSIVCVFGKCQYMNDVGDPIWMNKSGRFAVPLLRFGPQLIPQPGSLFLRSAFNAVGGLDPSYKQAFDLDLLIKLSKIGKIQYVPVQLSSFRWHDKSLSVGSRETSVSEAKMIRQINLPSFLRPISQLWEIPLSRLIYFAGVVLTLIDSLTSLSSKKKVS